MKLKALKTYVKVIDYKSKKLKNGANPLMVHLYHNKIRRYYRFLDERFVCYTNDEWDTINQCFTSKKSNFERLNSLIFKEKERIYNIIDNLNDRGNWTLNDFEKKFLKIDLIDEYAYQFFKRKLNESKNILSTRTILHKQAVLNSFYNYFPNFNRLFLNDFDQKYVDKYVCNLKREGLNDKSIKNYLNELTAFLDLAIYDEKIDRIKFRKDKYKFNTKTSKRWLNLDQIKFIKDYESENYYKMIYAKIWIFSFFTAGMNLGDIFKLQKKNIQTTYNTNFKQIRVIKYIRSKTKKEIEIPINQDIMEILLWFNLNTKLYKDYLFPIIKTDFKDRYDEDIFIKKRVSTCNFYLKKIGEEIGIENLTSYYARHSYAMCLRMKGVNVDMISECLGHSDIKTTQIYLDSFDLNEIQEVNKNLLDE